MKYKEAIKFLFEQLPMYQRQGKAAYKSNLENTHALDTYFKHPHKQFKTIHIAGTNGKGSVSHMLASVLQNAGFKTGLYTSPHLKDFRERIRINGTMISENKVTDFVTSHREIIQTVKPSFFEMTVAMAFDHFATNKVDIAIIETGLGGRLDSTNIIQPILSIITNIGLDHTQFLGDTLEKIAPEKAGIIKANTPIIIGQTQHNIKNIFIDTASKLNAPITFADQQLEIPFITNDLNGNQILRVYRKQDILYDNLVCDQKGSYQKHNIITALVAINTLIDLGYTIINEHIYNGIKNITKNTGLLGRWQLLGNNPIIIADTAHNEDGIQQIITQLNNTAHKQLHFVLGTVNDKNIEKILNMLPKDASYYFCEANIPRALDKSQLAETAQRVGLNGNIYNSVQEAYEAAKFMAEAHDMIYIGGSTFVVAEVI